MNTTLTTGKEARIKNQQFIPPNEVDQAIITCKYSVTSVPSQPSSAASTVVGKTDGAIAVGVMVDVSGFWAMHPSIMITITHVFVLAQHKVMKMITLSL